MKNPEKKNKSFKMANEKKDKSDKPKPSHKIAKVPWDSLVTQGFRESCSDNKIVTVEASCVTGFEPCAQEEVKEKLKVPTVEAYTGRVLFDLDQDRLGEVLKLRTVDNVWLVMGAKTGQTQSLLRNIDGIADFDNAS